MEALDQFGRFIVVNLRDKAIDQHIQLRDGKLKGESVQDLQNQVALLTTEQKDLMLRVMKDAIDTAMHDLLFAIQDAHDRNQGIEIIVSGTNVAEASGMLNGEPLGPDGWIVRFSQHQ